MKNKLSMIIKKKIIKSFNNPYIKQIKKLHNKKYRLKFQEFLVEGINLVDMAREANVLKTVILGEKDQYDFKNIIHVDSKIINYLATTINPQQIMGVVFLKEKKIDYNQNFVILENIQDPGNLGTILRNALAFGFKNIALTNNCVDLYNPKVIRSSQGAIFKLNIFSLKTTIDFFEKFKGIKVATSLEKKAIDIKKDLKLTKPFCIIFGNESKGITPSTLKLVDHQLKISISNINSLNVAVASGIFLNHLKTI